MIYDMVSTTVLPEFH